MGPRGKRDIERKKRVSDSEGNRGGDMAALDGDGNNEWRRGWHGRLPKWNGVTSEEQIGDDLTGEAVRGGTRDGKAANKVEVNSGGDLPVKILLVLPQA